MINPYEFLGLTVNSSMEELRKAYYSMSLTCHPDKGGSRDAMVVLHTAYKYIKAQLDNITDQPDAGKTYEALQEEFDNYIKNQDSLKPPSFLNVIAESLDIKPADYMAIYSEIAPKIPPSIMYDMTLCAINEMIRNKIIRNKISEEDAIKDLNKSDILAMIRDDLINFSNNHNDNDIMYSAAIPSGYGEFMDPSVPPKTLDYPEHSGNSGNSGHSEKYNIENGAVNSKIATNFEKKEMIIYHEPDSIGGFATMAGDLPIPEKKEDYTVYDSGTLPLTDYKRAYSDETLDSASSIFAALCSEDSIDVRLAAQRLERTRLDDTQKERLPEVVKLKY
uniref:J domain-containing protein n=1 Tax=viral metagenome TaxID=1070528 RepID=A0A6C0KX57_9ZZZZ